MSVSETGKRMLLPLTHQGCDDFYTKSDQVSVLEFSPPPATGHYVLRFFCLFIFIMLVQICDKIVFPKDRLLLAHKTCDCYCI